MIKRGWISHEPLRKAIILKHCIADLQTTSSYKNALMLALIAEVVECASNVKFGPELYCGPAKKDADVFSGFAKRVQIMAKDLDIISSIPVDKVQVIQGDARDCRKLLEMKAPGPYTAVICSPPYPAEHDYTRNTRLELAFLEEVSDRQTLREIKQKMIRSHTKGVYKGDSDATFVKGHPVIDAITRELERKSEQKTYGFARFYPVVVQEYFGGMKRHLANLIGILAPAAKCAYVLGDQSSYLQVHIPTAEILASLAEDIGFETLEIKRWRSRRSSTTSKEIHENILILRKRF